MQQKSFADQIAGAKAKLLADLDPTDTDYEEQKNQIEIQMKDENFQKQVLMGIQQEMVINMSLKETSEF